MIHFFTHTYASSGIGPTKFARAVRARTSSDELAVYTQDPGPLPERGVVPLPGMPRWLRSNLAYFEYQSWHAAQALTTAEVNLATDVVVFNNLLAGRRVYRDAPCATVGFVNDDNNLRYRQTARGLAQRVQRAALRRLERTYVNQATLTVVNSRYLKRQVVEAYRANPDDVYVLYKGVDVDDYQMTFTPLPERSDVPLRVFFAKSDWRRGGLENLLRAVEIVARTRAVRLRVAGTDGQGVGASLAPGLVDYLGVVPADTVRRELAAAHVFCTPSLFEALGVANMEAMLSGTPVVASDAGGIPEVTDYGRYATQISPHSPRQIAEALLDLAADPKGAARRAEAARAYVRAKFSIQQSVDSLRECCALARDSHAARSRAS